MDETDASAYANKALLILNMLRGELYRYSDTYSAATSGTRPICPVLTGLDSLVGLDDFLAQTIMPYGLAANLMLGDDDAKANFFQQRYEELLMKYGSVIPANTEDINNIYGGIEYSPCETW